MIFKNFAITTVTTAPPTALGTSLTVASSGGDLFPDTPFNATVWPIGELPISTNAEIVRVTDITGDVFTIQRMQEDSKHRIIQFGDQIAATITAKTAHDIKNLNSIEISGSNYSVPELIDTVVVNDTDSRNVDLPQATGTGRVIRVKNINTGIVYFRPSGFDNIDGENVLIPVYQWESIGVCDYAVGEWITI
jgi:hypothetical protein